MKTKKLESLRSPLFEFLTNEQARQVSAGDDTYHPERTNVGDPIAFDYIKDSAV